MTWALILWISMVPGRWVALELPTASLEECQAAVRAAADQLRTAGAHEFVASCRPRP